MDLDIQAVRELGKKIGYGNMMWIAHALWAEQLQNNIGTDAGAFIPVLPDDVKGASKPSYKGSSQQYRERIKSNKK